MEHSTEVTTRSTGVTHCTCDICGAVTVDHRDGRMNYERPYQEVTLSAWNYTETYHGDEKFGTTLRVDLCIRCLVDKVMPFLESQGAKLRVLDAETRKPTDAKMDASAT